MEEQDNTYKSLLKFPASAVTDALFNLSVHCQCFSFQMKRMYISLENILFIHVDMIL